MVIEILYENNNSALDAIIDLKKLEIFIYEYFVDFWYCYIKYKVAYILDSYVFSSH